MYTHEYVQLNGFIGENTNVVTLTWLTVIQSNWSLLLVYYICHYDYIQTFVFLEQVNVYYKLTQILHTINIL